MTETQRIALIPRDGFFCKDGRGWHTSSSGRGHALDWPWPSTILGALRTASGRDREANEGRFSSKDWQEHAGKVKLARLLALRRPVAEEWGLTHRVWPVPQDALWLEGNEDAAGKPKPELRRLKPRRPEANAPQTLGRLVDGNDDLREALWFPQNVDGEAKPLSRPRWWGEVDFINWLAGNESAVSPNAPAWGKEPIRRVQTRVGIDAKTLTAEDAVLFSHDVIESLDRFGGDPAENGGDSAESEHAFAYEWAIGAEVTLPGKLAQKTARLGSDSRLAWIEEMSGGLFDPPEALLKAFEEKKPLGLRLVVVTPAKFPSLNRHGNDRLGGWLPSGFTGQGGVFQGQLRGIPSGGVILRAAFVPRSMHVSGWNMTGAGSPENKRRGGGRKAQETGAPKETSRLVAPGAVYFFERADGTPFTRSDAETLWLSAMGGRTSEGFGLVVPGVWNPNDTEQEQS